MAIRVPNLGTGNGQTGDNELKIRQDYNHNFTDQSNAASRPVGTDADQIPLSSQVPSLLGTAATKNVGTGADQIPLSSQVASLLGTAATKNVGTATGNVMGVGAFGLGASGHYAPEYFARDAPSEVLRTTRTMQNGNYGTLGYGFGWAIHSNDVNWSVSHATGRKQVFITRVSNVNTAPNSPERLAAISHGEFVILDFNASKDSNGFIKAASPIVRVFADKIECNDDAEKQNIEYIKNGVGDYLIKNSSGLSNDGWYIETPKDANGNVLVAVVYKQLENGDISVKTYAKKFDDETGDIVPNLARPRDIPETRWIDLRLNEIEKEPPVMPMDEPTTEV